MTGNETRPIVGMIGMGNIGSGVSQAIAREGFSVVACDVLPDALEAASGFARPAATPREVAEQADIVFLAVYDDAQVRDVLAGGDDSIVAATPAPRVVAILATVTIETIRWAEEQAASREIALLDCGVTGGSRLREHGRIVAIVGGADDAVAYARPVLEAFGEPVVHTGALGTGMQAKIARNMITYGTWYVVLEAAALAAASGVDVEKLAEICDAGDEWSGGAIGILHRGTRAGPPQDEADLARRRSLSGYVHKDLGAAFELAAEVGVDLPAARMVAEHFDATMGLSGPDTSP